MPNNEDRIGALWMKTSARGDFFTGQLEINGEKIAIVVFPNSRKTQDKQPDWQILRARPRGEA